MARVKCRECNGTGRTGRDTYEVNCSFCDGSGYVDESASSSTAIQKFKTDDGRVFDNRDQAQTHANQIGFSKDKALNYLNEGMKSYNKGGYENAISSFSSAITFFGGDYYFEKAEPYYYQGLSYLAIGNQKDAKFAFESAVRISSNSGFGAKAKEELSKLNAGFGSSSSSSTSSGSSKSLSSGKKTLIIILIIFGVMSIALWVFFLQFIKF